MLKRAYSLLTVKAFDEDARTITGIATTPTPDRLGDVVVPEGAEFNLPIPLLWQHDSRQPIGEVTAAKVSEGGIEVTARLISVDGPSLLKNRLDEAWASIKSGLVKGLSIGFRALESEELPHEDTGDPFEDMFPPLKFIRWAWLELSAVTIPANADAKIETVRAIAHKQLDIAAPGDPPKPHLEPAKDETVRRGSVSLKRKEPAMQTADHIKALEAKHAANVDAMKTISDKAADENRTMDEEEVDKFEELKAETQGILKELERLRDLEKLSASTAKEVVADDKESGTASRGGQIRVRSPKLPPGVAFSRVARCIALASKGIASATEIAKERYPDHPEIVEAIKAPVAAGTTHANNWATNLVADEMSPFADFAEYLRPMTILGKFGQGVVPGLRVVPFRTALVGQSSGQQGYWVGEAEAKPLTRASFTRTTLTPLKVAAIVVASEELLRDSSPSAEIVLRDDLAAAVTERIDLDFIDPSKAAVSGVSPASITNGITATTSAGNDADSVRTDVKAVFNKLKAANIPLTGGVWIMSAQTLTGLMLLHSTLGTREFPDITIDGGVFAGYPVIASENVPDDSNGFTVAFINAREIYFADEGGVTIDVSREASLEMEDSPTGSAEDQPTATSVVSLWQTNSVGMRAERTLNWSRRRDDAVAVLDNVNWGN